MNILNSPEVAAVLEREHNAAKAQRIQRLANSAPKGKSPQRPDFRTSEMHKTNYLSIGPTQGRWLFAQAVACKAQEIVEFGTSFGISTLYLAAAATENKGRVTGTEFHPEKAEKARRNLAEAGLAATILTGDARETLAVDGPKIDLLFLDGANELYLPILEMLLPRLGGGSVVIADNIPVSEEERRENAASGFDAYLNRPEHQFVTSVLGFGKGGMSFSVKL
ncbi:hypothetical protein CAP48_14895 [Advenella sp. S44]|uniref:O-methyltransferase n=1 Tax=Advenella sp. S44 TaxID=1982755 RepID=UPI000C2AFA8F|nr:class I SAM-dependent methyltransferase [Advenella sp. S44]PJX22218.1 hypothetical protein CAP48_14895 [Advenella sp. S44]